MLAIGIEVGIGMKVTGLALGLVVKTSPLPSVMLIANTELGVGVGSRVLVVNITTELAVRGISVAV